MQTTLNAETAHRLFKNINRLIEQNYVLREQVDALLRQLERTRLPKTEQPEQWASALTDELYRLTGDGHFSLLYDPEQAEQLKRFQNNLLQDHLPDAKAEGELPAAGIRQAAMLPGKVGYIDIRDFLATPGAGSAITSAMQLMAGCTAIIFDLRHNSGGEVSMVQWLASYLFDEQPRLLHLYADPRIDFKPQIWTHAFVPGVRHPRTAIYILVSRNTFSAAEEFAYDLQAMGRAVVVGEQTGGGAHLTEQHATGYGFILNIPVAQIINPITGSNWQGTGITPDVVCSSDTALATAHLHALETIWHKESDPAQKERLQWDMETVKAHYQPTIFDETLLSNCIGQYDGREVLLRDGHLYLRYQHTLNRLMPIAANIFYVDGQDAVRIAFERENQQVRRMVVTQRDDPGRRAVRSKQVEEK